MVLPELSPERVDRYRQSYLMASNAVLSRTVSFTEARKVFDELIDAEVAPNVVTYSALVAKADSWTPRRTSPSQPFRDSLLW
jgi:hypothetical protein